MKAKELMIGDWYCNQEYQEKRQWTIDDYMEVNTEYCEPIPLTKDILDRNRFLLKRLECEYCSPEDIAFHEPIRLQIGEDGNAFWWIVGYVIVTPINYVHELQHALRLCGLNELADNLKV